MAAAKASLTPDGGAAAAEPGEFFRSPEFLEAEGVTHTLAIEGRGATMRLPLLVRGIEGSELVDAVSPYGYPGAADPLDPPVEADQIDFSETGLVSVFVRDRIGGPPAFAGATERSEVQIADPRAETGIRKRLREQIRRNQREGWRVAAEPGPQAEDADRLAFERAYAETMERTGAAPRYLYSSDYFRGVLASPSSWLLLAGREGEPASAGAIAVASDHHLHYYLGGTAEEALSDSPMKNVFAAMISLAGELGLRVNLGGGVEPGDSLERFKRGFANASEPFRTHEIVCDRAAYEELSAADPDGGGYFPAYRA